MLSWGCYPIALLQSPRTQPPKTVELTVVAPRLGSGSPSDSSSLNRLQYLPVPELAARLGVADGWDVGVRGRLCCALEASVKHEILRGSTDVAVDLGVINGSDSRFAFDSQTDSPSKETSFTVARLSMLTGWIVDDSTLWVSPGIHAGHRYGEYTGPDSKITYSLPLVAPALTAGIKVPIGGVTSFFAETGFIVPVAGERVGPFGGWVRLGPRDIRVEGTIGLAFAFGRRADAAPTSEPPEDPAQKPTEFHFQ
jgi:hypothetical protein